MGNRHGICRTARTRSRVSPYPPGTTILITVSVESSMRGHRRRASGSSREEKIDEAWSMEGLGRTHLWTTMLHLEGHDKLLIPEIVLWRIAALDGVFDGVHSGRGNLQDRRSFAIQTIPIHANRLRHCQPVGIVCLPQAGSCL